MFNTRQYELLDFGGGEKLERFGDHIVRRQSPSVDRYVTDKNTWDSDLRFVREPKPQWQPTLNGDDAWNVIHREKCFLLKQSPSGQVGVFPEQADNWDWIEERRKDLAGMRAINLFAYTGGTTMQLAKCGVQVTHVDAAKPVVEWAKRNAEASQLHDAKIRWIVDDALAYLGREANRNREYDIVVADPPSFGRGRKGAVWKLERDLPKLLDLTKAIAPNLKMLILSCHTPNTNARDLQQLAKGKRVIHRGAGEPLTLQLRSRANKTLDSGQCFRWTEF